jgi:hypothetical protein
MLKEGHHNLIGKVVLLFYDFFAPKARKNRTTSHTYGHPNDEIRNVIGKTTVTTAMASGPIHCPTNIVSIRMFRDMNKIPIEAGAACFISSFLCLWFLIRQLLPFNFFESHSFSNPILCGFAPGINAI